MSSFGNTLLLSSEEIKEIIWQFKPQSFNFSSEVPNPFKCWKYSSSFADNPFCGYYTPKVLFESWTDTSFVSITAVP